MKPTTLLLLASLIANIALVSVIYSFRSGLAFSPHAANGVANSSVTANGDGPAAHGERELPMAGNAARDADLTRAFARFVEKMRAARTSNDGAWWRRSSANGDREKQHQAVLELSAAMLAAFGDDLGIGGLDSRRIDFLPAEKRDSLRRVLSDYDDLMTKFGAQGGITLASDREKLKLLRAERDRDVAALLTPDELAEYQMRSSPATDTIRNRYGDAITSEDQFKKIYELQKAFDEKFPVENFNGRVTPEAMKARSEAALQFQADLRAAVGDDAYAALKRAGDTDLRTVDALVSRLNLPADTTDRIAAARETYAAESQRIMADTSTPFPQRRDQVQALATRAKSELTNALGAEAADAYAQRSQWVSMLQGGIGFSTTPSANSPGALAFGTGNGPSVFPVTPAGAAVGTRQIVNISSSSTGSSGSGGAVIMSAGGATGPGTSMQDHVFSISTSTTDEPHGPPATATVIAPSPTNAQPTGPTKP